MMSRLQPPFDEWMEEEAVDPQMVIERVQALADEAMAAKLKEVEPEALERGREAGAYPNPRPPLEEHLATLDALRQVIHLRSYAQKKPIDEYKQEAFLLFERLLVAIREEVTRVLMRATVQFEPPPLPELPAFITQHLDPFGRRRHVRHRCRARGLLSSVPPLNIPQPSFPLRDRDGVVEGPISRNAPCRAARARSTSIATGSSREARAGACADGPDRAEARLPARGRKGRRRTPRPGAADEIVAEATATARALVKGVRAQKPSGVDAFLHAYDLGSDEGIAMMCLAEALLRIPDSRTPPTS